MSIDFNKFKKKSEPKQEPEREIVREDMSDKSEKSDKSDKIQEIKSDKSDIPPNYNITSDQLRAIYVMITGKTNRGYSKKMLRKKLLEILSNAE